MIWAGGAETHLVTIGGQLLRLGHEVVVYSPEVGPFADYATERGLKVVDDARKLPDECDVVFAQDSLVVYDVADRYPGALMVFRICGDIRDLESPPQVDGVVDLVVVLSDRYARLAQALAVRTPLLRLRVPVDIDRLKPVGAPRARPKRAVVLGNFPDRIRVIREAWEPRGIEVTHVGATNQRYDVAAALQDADIVVAKSRAAVDAMACGRAVYVFDTFGGDGWVTPEAYTAMEADNFAGLATGRVVRAAELAQDLADYDPDMGLVNRDLAVQHHSARDHVAQLVAAVDGSAANGERITPLRELSRLTALQWSWERFARGTQHTLGAVHDRALLAEQKIRELEQRLEQVAAEASAEVERERAKALASADELAAVRVAFDELGASRAVRLCSRYWRWRDRLLRRPG
jgi:hypothetical protein